MKQTILLRRGVGGENDINIYHLIKGKTKTKETQGGSGTKEADGSPGAGPAMHAG